ncbi:MAG: hypothetical protein JNM51_00695 [Bacteroidia bacterium]|nr:hypothetical protein [Bacteroidia bacterium]
MMSDEEFDKRIMNWGEGNDNYTKIADVALNTNGTLNITKQDLEVSCDTLNKNNFNQEIACYGTWISSPAFNLSPFKLIMFTNFSNISAIDGGAQTMKGTAKIVPAIYLKYSKDKETNYKIEKGISYTIDGLSLISGVGTVLNGGFKALNWGRKAWIVYNTSVATANILVNASDIPNDPDFQDAYQAYTAITIASGLGELSYNGIKNFSSCLRTTKSIANTTTQITKQQYLNLINKLDAVYVKLQSGALTLNANGMKAYKKLKAYTDRLKQNWQKLFKEPLPVGLNNAGNSISFLNGWTKQSIIAKVSELKSLGQKLNPTQYLSSSYITNHLNKFKTKASYLVTGDTYDNFILGKATVGRPDGLFISTADDIDAVIAKANGNISIIEQELGIPAGSWQGKGGIVRIDINNPENFNLRIPDGSEAGANSLWEPGGLTSGGKVEAVTNPIPTTNINANKIIQ